MIPLLFVGEEFGSHKPFLFFTDHNDELSKLVCEGRRKEFADFSLFANGESLENIPDPNALTTFENSVFDYADHQAADHQTWRNFYKRLLALRSSELTPHLPGTFSQGADALADLAVTAAWKLGNGDIWRIYINFSEDNVSATPSWANAKIIFEHGILKPQYQDGILPAQSILVTIETGI